MVDRIIMVIPHHLFLLRLVVVVDTGTRNGLAEYLHDTVRTGLVTITGSIMVLVEIVFIDGMERNTRGDYECFVLDFPIVTTRGSITDHVRTVDIENVLEMDYCTGDLATGGTICHHRSYPIVSFPTIPITSTSTHRGDIGAGCHGPL